MKKILAVIVALLLAAYPFLVYFGCHYLDFQALTLLIAILFIARSTLSHITRHNRHSIFSSTSMMLLSGSGLLLCLIAFFSQGVLFIKLYPICVNLVFFILFTTSLINPPSIITEIAQKTRQSPLSSTAIHYTQKVTITWCIFFCINGLISTYTALFSSMNVWLLYNGFISYLLIASLFLIEIIIRYFVIRKEQQDV